MINISEGDFQKFREYFYRKTGIYFEDSKRYFVDKRLTMRMLSTQCDNFRAYFMLLRFQSSGEEFQELINLMTVNETYFFREEYQFKCLVNSMLNEIVSYQKRKESIRIWSVPCSSGEEPYSLAMYILEKWEKIDEYDVEITASDIDTKILNNARAGIYDQRSLRELPSEFLEKYFHVLPNGQYQICEALRSSIDFTQANLASVCHGIGQSFDVIFCRNLLIYFDDLSRRAAAETFYELLNPGGFICLGHSESMSRISSFFKVRKFQDAIVYQKDRLK